VTDLKDGPQNFMSLFPLMRCVLCVLHLVTELQQRVFYVFKACWRRFAIAGCANRRHFSGYFGVKEGIDVEAVLKG